MKKIAILAALAMPAMAGTPTVVTVPTPEVAPAPVACPCSVEVAGVYRFADRDITTVGKSIDTYGVDLTFVHALNDHNAVTLRAGYAYGSEVYREEDYSCRHQLDSFTLMPGYRYTHPVCDCVSLFAGANAGVIRSNITSRVEWEGPQGVILKDHDWAFATSAEAGVSFKVCDNVSLFAAYEFSFNTAKFYSNETHNQTYHGIRVGVSYKF